MKKLSALLIAVLLIISIIPAAVLAEDGEEESADPNQILWDPDFDLNTVDEGVLSDWYFSEIRVPDEALRRALQNAAKVNTLTVESMFTLPTTLDFSGLGIKDLTGLEYAINVTEIKLVGNEITDLGPVSRLYNLRKLDYSDNKVETVPSWLFRAKSLTYVNGSGNASTSVEPFTESTNVLQSLYLERNSLSLLPDMSALQSMETLSLAGNEFTTFPDTVLTFTNLRILSLSDNMLEECPDMGSFKMLNTLYLDTNRLYSVPRGLERLPLLTELYLYSNNISEITESITSSESLISLYLYFNNISKLPQELTEMKSLMNLDLSFNVLESESNLTVMSALSDKLSSFHHSFQMPILISNVHHPEDGNDGVLLKWTGIDPYTGDDGNYSVMRYSIERRIDETLSPEELIVRNDDAGDSDGTEPEEGTDGEDGEGEGEPSEGEEAGPGNEPPGTIMVNEFVTIGECAPDVTSFADTTAKDGVYYIYRITAYVSCEYRHANPVIYEITSESKTSEMMSDISGKNLFIYIGAVVIAIGLMVFAIIRISKTRKKPQKIEDIKEQKREEMRELNKTRPQKVDLSESVSKAWVETGSLEDEIDKILAGEDDLFDEFEEKEPEKEETPVSKLFSKKNRR